MEYKLRDYVVATLIYLVSPNSPFFYSEALRKAGQSRMFRERQRNLERRATELAASYGKD